jgi:hypothetical protein
MISTGKLSLKVYSMLDRMISFSELLMLACHMVMSILEMDQDLLSLLLLIEFM